MIVAIVEGGQIFPRQGADSLGGAAGDMRRQAIFKHGPGHILKGQIHRGQRALHFAVDRAGNGERRIRVIQLIPPCFPVHHQGLQLHQWLKDSGEIEVHHGH